MEDLEKNGSGGGGFVPLTDLVPAARPSPDLEAVKAKLSNARGREYWRSLDELANTEEFQRYLQREFPLQAPRDMQPLNRRDFMRVMGATMALAGVGGCAYQPPEKIVPYVQQPEVVVPGKPLFYATAYEHAGFGIGLLAESHMGRPIKLEGNPEHPASLGSTDIFAQASLLQLYDPDRAQNTRFQGAPSTWDAFTGDVVARLNRARANGGAGVRIIIGSFTSPTLTAQVQRFLNQYPSARICFHDPVERTGARAALGDVHAVYRFDRAERILALDSDFLVDEPGSVRYARDFAAGRRVRDGRLEMNRLYVVESSPTVTGTNADHRQSVKPSQVEAVARAIAAQLGVGGGGDTHVDGVSTDFISAVAQDLRQHPGRSVVVAGPYASAAVHALAHAINTSLGNVGQTVTYTAPVQARFPGREATLAQVTEDIRNNRVDLLLVLGDANPVYSAPADVEFGAALRAAVAATGQGGGLAAVRMGLYEDETAELCHWFVPQSHYLESWSDVLAYDGTASIVQPLITPLYATHTLHELFSVLTGQGDRPSYDIVREYWQGRLPGNFEQAWRQALHQGVIPNARPLAPATPTASSAIPETAAATGGLEIVFRPDPTIWDGSYANNQWLQELPKPLSQLTWDNAALISPATAKQLAVKNGDMLDLVYDGRSLNIPAYIVPAHPNDTITVYLGYGRARAGRIGNGTGFNAYRIRTSKTPWWGAGVEARKAGRKYQLASAQMHFYMEGRGIVKTGTLQELEEHPNDPHFMHGEHHTPASSLYDTRWPSDQPLPPAHGEGAEAHSDEPKIAGAPHRPGRQVVGPVPGTGPSQWGMVIDLNACIGCNACVIACQAENNISTVGKDQVLNNREMHWIRVSTYYTGSPEDPQDPVFQPVPCMHCEKAPCEPVCPVEATSHSPEGINEMTYNRCIGTRYCENNCPYKVRRFNYFQYADQKTPTIELMRNPDVTVRSRGVMEKCTYCVQRVNQARIEAEKENRPLRDGDVITACAQVCPTEAIIFGDISDTSSNNGKGSRVRQAKLLPLNYALLTELNTQPRTSYLAKLRNPNPALASATGETAPKAGH